MFFWVDFSSWWSSIISVAGLCLATLVAWLVLYLVYRLFTDNRIQRPVRNGAGAVEPRGLIARTTIALGTGLGLLCSRGPNANNRRAKTFLVLLALVTIGFAFGYLPYAYNHAHPNGLRDAVLTETFGQQPLPEKSMTRSAYLPDPDVYYGTTPPTSSTPTERPATSILWLFFWVFVLLPLLWAIGILYFVLALREETYGGIRSFIGRVQEWVSNLGESGIRGKRSAGGAQGGLSFSAPIVITPGGAAAVAAEAEKEKTGMPWTKIVHWLKRNSGEVVAGLFVIDEILELGLRRKHRTNTNTND